MTGLFRTASVDCQQLETSVLGRPSDEEALRMVVAFCCIMEPEKRAELLKLAEQFASESQVIEGVTHFLLLERNIGEGSASSKPADDQVPVGKPGASQT